MQYGKQRFKYLSTPSEEQHAGAGSGGSLPTLNRRMSLSRLISRAEKRCIMSETTFIES